MGGKTMRPVELREKPATLPSATPRKTSWPFTGTLRRAGKVGGLSTWTGIILTTGALYFGRSFFIPIALSALLVFLLAPLVNRLVRAGWNNVIAVAAAVSVAFVLLSSVGVIVGLQLYDLAQ